MIIPSCSACSEILKASEKDTTADKADMRIVEAAAKKVSSRFGH